ncbi:unnamed protein product, partial [Amoebophrya sp. A25]
GVLPIFADKARGHGRDLDQNEEKQLVELVRCRGILTPSAALASLIVRPSDLVRSLLERAPAVLGSSVFLPRPGAVGSVPPPSSTSSSSTSSPMMLGISSTTTSSIVLGISSTTTAPMQLGISSTSPLIAVHLRTFVIDNHVWHKNLFEARAFLDREEDTRHVDPRDFKRNCTTTGALICSLPPNVDTWTADTEWPQRVNRRLRLLREENADRIFHQSSNIVSGMKAEDTSGREMDTLRQSFSDLVADWYRIQILEPIGKCVSKVRRQAVTLSSELALQVAVVGDSAGLVEDVKRFLKTPIRDIFPSDPT